MKGRNLFGADRWMPAVDQDTGELAVSVIYDAKADGRSPRQNVVVEGLAAGRGGGKGLLLAAAAAAPAYFGFRFLADKVSFSKLLYCLWLGLFPPSDRL